MENKKKNPPEVRVKKGTWNFRTRDIKGAGKKDHQTHEKQKVSSSQKPGSFTAEVPSQRWQEEEITA